MFEKVNPAHPDKIADRIAGALVDLAYKSERNPRIAVELLIGHGTCHIIAETSVQLSIDDVTAAVHRIAGFLNVDYSEVPQDVHLSRNQSGAIRCGDNGIFKGVPVTAEQKELVSVATDIYNAYPFDGKYIIDNGRVIICQSNAKADHLREIYPAAEINPLGDWTGGTDVDTGATNRKLGSDKNGPQGDGINEDVSFTLNTVDRHAVYAMTTGSFTQVAEDKAPTVLARDYKDPTAVCYGIGRDTFNQGKNAKFAPTFEEELQPTLVAKGPGAIQSGYTVRRLTPTECARLQGFPDWWCDDLGVAEPTMEDIRYWYDVFETHRRIVGSSTKPKSLKQIAKWLRDPHSDAAEYKMWGNGVALPCVVFVLSGIVYCTQSEG